MRLPFALALALAAAFPATALEIEIDGFYDLNRPASLEFDPDFCGLWIANEGPEVVLVTLEGLELRRFSTGLRRVKAIALEGTRVLVSDGYGGYQRLTRDGAPVSDPFHMGALWMDTEGIVALPDGTLVHVEDDPARIVWTDPEGRVQREIDGLTYQPALTEPQGIAVEPRTGNLLIVDDWEGTNSIFELDAEGRLLATAPLIAYGRDPEGIALRAGANQLFVAFDGGARIAAFAYRPTLPDGMTLEDAPPDCVMF
jgi:hypothetical protein